MWRYCPWWQGSGTGLPAPGTVARPGRSLGRISHPVIHALPAPSWLPFHYLLHFLPQNIPNFVYVSHARSGKSFIFTSKMNSIPLLNTFYFNQIILNVLYRLLSPAVCSSSPTIIFISSIRFKYIHNFKIVQWCISTTIFIRTVLILLNNLSVNDMV